MINLKNVNKKNLKTIIIACITVILVIISIICLISNSKKRRTDISTKDFENYVSDEQVFYVTNFLNTYYTYNSYKSKTNESYRFDEKGNADELEENFNMCLNSDITDKEKYIRYEKFKFLPTKIKAKKVKDIEFYAVEGYETSQEQTYVTEVDAKKVAYNVAYDPNSQAYLVNSIGDNIEDCQRTFSIKEITRNQANKKIEIGDVKASIPEKLFKMTTDFMFYAPEALWEKLDLQYREKRFEDLDSFKQYCTNYKTVMLYKTMEGYIEKEDKYVIKDNVENVYTYTINTNYLDYTAILDEYTLKNEEFDKEFEEYSDMKKVAVFIADFVSMVNNYDAHQLYLAMNETYKLKNFNNEENIYDYLKFEYPGNYILEDNQIERIGDYYKVTLKLYNGQSKDIEEKMILVDPTSTTIKFAFGSKE